MRFALLFICTLALAQEAHWVELAWNDTINPPETTYSVKRAPGICSGTPVFATVATGLIAKTYNDKPIPPGNYCYTVTATYNGMESGPSNTASAAVPAKPPTGINAQIK
jgi:hypothetical protein